MKVWRGFTLVFWVLLMTTCVSIVAMYFVASQTILSPTAMKRWLDQSGSYTMIAEAVVPVLASDDSAVSTNSILTPDMLKRAAKTSIKSTDVKADVEPIVDAIYSWLDSKSPEVTFTVNLQDEEKNFLAALRSQLYTKLNALPECKGYVDPSELEQAKCLPSYVTTDRAVDEIMARVGQRDIFRDHTLTAESFTGKVAPPNPRLPDALSLLWVIQLVAIPVAAVIALFVTVKRRGAGLAAVGVSLLLPGIGLIIIGLLLRTSGSSVITDLIGQSEFASIIGSISKVAVASVASLTLLVSGVLTVTGVILTGLGIWWRRRRAARA